MGKIFKAMSLGMTVLAAVMEAMDASSDEGENISQAEFVRIAVRSGVAALGAFGKEITNSPDTDILQVMREELQNAGMII